MAKSNPVRAIMESPLPSITYQKRKLFRPSHDDLITAYKMINRHVFDNVLSIPDIKLIQTQKCWGYCQWLDDYQNNGSYCKIRLNRNWFCPQWFMNTLAHEMCHQYVWDRYRWEHHEIHGREIYTGGGGHGPSFFMWRDRFSYHGLTLKTAFGQNRWFKYQDFSKC